MEPRMFDTVLLSDLHLGSETSRAIEALETLERLAFRRLILLGDIFCDLNFRRLKKEHWKFLSYIRKLSNPRRGIEVVWVEGNHDVGLAELMSHLVGVQVYQEYTWEEAGQRNLAIHGHQFDGFVINDRFCLSSLGSHLYLIIQKIDGQRQRVARLLDRWKTRWLRLTERVAAGALARARMRGATRVFCGHTHQADTMQRDGIRYYNSGCWTSARPTYITVAGLEVTIHEYVERADDRHTGEERGEAIAEVAGFPGRAGLPGDGEYAPAYC